MADFVIIPDSASDMTAPLRERFGIPECRMGTVTYPNGESKEVDLDWETMTPDEFYGMMKNKSVEFKSSTPIPAKEVEIYKKYLAKYEIPREIRFIPELPKTKLAKVDFKALENL